MQVRWMDPKRDAISPPLCVTRGGLHCTPVSEADGGFQGQKNLLYWDIWVLNGTRSWGASHQLMSGTQCTGIMGALVWTGKVSGGMLQAP